MIKWMLLVVGLLIVLMFVGTLYVRLAPHDPAQWHVDPATVTDVNSNNQHLDSASVPGDVPTVTARLAEVLDGEVMSGSYASGFVTLVVRTPLYGYPDYVSIRVAEEDAGKSRVTIFSRSRYGELDFGANKARVERVLSELRAALPTDS